MRRAAAPEVLGSEHKRLFVLSLLPTSTTLVAQHSEYLFCDEGLLLELDDGAWQLLTFEQIAASKIQAERNVVVIGEHRFKAVSCRAARQQCRLIQRLTESAQPSPLVAAYLRRSTDPDRAERHTHVLRERLQVLQQLQFLLLTWIFGAGGVLYYFSADPWHVLPRYLLITVAIWMAAIAAAWSCSRRLYPIRSSDRWKELFFSLVSPMHAARASDRLSLDGLGDEHPLAVAIATMPHRQLKPFAQQQIAQLRHPRTSELNVVDDSPGMSARLLQARRSLADALANSLSRYGINVDELSRPDQQDHGAVCWCQRCFSQYTRLIETCPDCPGVATITFSDETSNDSGENQTA